MFEFPNVARRLGGGTCPRAHAAKVLPAASHWQSGEAAQWGTLVSRRSARPEARPTVSERKRGDTLTFDVRAWATLALPP